MKSSIVILIIVLAVAIVLLLRCSSKSHYSLLDSAYGESNPGDYSTAFHQVGHRPPIQDFLPVVGEEPLGSNDRLFEDEIP
jgi:hypothetical protein